jgi:hypothetical protein
MQAAEVVRYVRVMRVECGFSEDLVEGPQQLLKSKLD